LAIAVERFIRGTPATIPDPPASFQQMFATLFSENQAVMVQRQVKYGKHNVPRYGTHGTIVRMGDKFSRLENMLEGGDRFEGSNDESIEDTLIDIANYATILRAQLRGWWTKEHCPDLLPEH
jgi:hypothetical protein